MKINDKQYKIIKKIATNRQNNTFAYFTKDDIYQEIWILCIEALSSYNAKKGNLENFLNKHVSNRLKNLKRDKYFNPSHDENSKTRINLINALSIYEITFSEQDVQLMSINNQCVDPIQNIILYETIDNIISKLPKEYITYFYSLINLQKIPKRIFMDLKTYIMRIIENE